MITEVLFEVTVTWSPLSRGQTVRAACTCGGTYTWRADSGAVATGPGARAWDDQPGPPPLEIWMGLHALSCPDTP